MDQRGFLFILPRGLGLPDPLGEWHVVKAAIGVKAEIVQLVVDTDIPTPPHPPVHFSHTAFAPVEIGGVMWALSLVRPQSLSPNALPQFFSLKLKRGPAGAMPGIPATPLPANTEWVFVPMHIYQEQMAMVASPFSPLTAVRQPVYSGGTVEDVRRWQRNSEKAGREVSDEEATEGDILDSAWDAQLHREFLLTAARRGDRSLPTTRPLHTLLRIQPASDGDFRAIQYLVVRIDKPLQAQVVEKKWQLLPSQAMRADGERKFVNLVRMLVGKTAFSKEEWPSARAGQQPEQQQQSQSSSSTISA